jgi:hypothetical protein
VATRVPAGVYDSVMRSVPTVLALLSFPAGAIAYAVTVRALEWMDLSGDGREILMLFIPLFVAGLVMMPFLIPFIDRKAKADLAAIARVQGEEPRGTGDDQPEAPDKP